MKRIWLLYPIAIFFLMESCQKEDNNSFDNKSYLTSTPLSLDAEILKGVGGETTLTISSSAPWKATSTDNWLTITPSVGPAGETEVTVITKAHMGSSDRYSEFCFKTEKDSLNYSIKQRVNIFKRTPVASGRVTCGTTVTYFGSTFYRFYSFMPRPVSNIYQDISNFSAPGCVEEVCENGLTHYIWKDDDMASTIKSGGFVICEQFDATLYQVSADVSLISDIPPYDSTSFECKSFLGNVGVDYGEQNGGISYYVDTSNAEIVSIADNLWKKANGDILDYARKCYDWTHNRLAYKAGILPVVKQILENGEGDCSCYSSVCVSLLRRKGIPARHLVMRENTDYGWHVRVEFYVPAYGWIALDPTWGGNNFGIHGGDYIVMSIDLCNRVRWLNGEGSTIPVICFQFPETLTWYHDIGVYDFQYVCHGLSSL